MPPPSCRRTTISPYDGSYFGRARHPDRVENRTRVRDDMDEGDRLVVVAQLVPGGHLHQLVEGAAPAGQHHEGARQPLEPDVTMTYARSLGVVALRGSGRAAAAGSYGGSSTVGAVRTPANRP